MIDLAALGGLSYNQAAHFFRWLWMTYGAAKVMRIYTASAYDDSHRDSVSKFEHVFGESLVDVGDRYLREVPRELPSLHVPEMETLPWDGDTWRHSFELDCDNDQTFIADRGVERFVVIDIPETGEYDLYTDGVIQLMADGLEEYYFTPRYGALRRTLSAGHIPVRLVEYHPPATIEISFRRAPDL
jgi:hypothetical protein